MRNFGYWLLSGLLLWGGLTAAPVEAAERAYYRIEILSDIHLPVRSELVAEEERQQRIIAAKEAVLADINQSADVDQVVVLGDVVANTGNTAEYDFAAQFFAQLHKPITFVVGNHDYLYKDGELTGGKRVRGSSEERLAKLQRFQEKLQVPELYHSQQVGQYLLVFLSVDAPESTCLTELSGAQLAWFKAELAAHAGQPTIVFFHAPLRGALSQYPAALKEKNAVAQPAEALAAILREEPQVFLWVSGHTHTSIKNPDFAAPVNWIDGRILNVHNPDMDKERICTNTLWLYPEEVVIKTYDHTAKAWLPAFERHIARPLVGDKQELTGGDGEKR